MGQENEFNYEQKKNLKIECLDNSDFDNIQSCRLFHQSSHAITSSVKKINKMLMLFILLLSMLASNDASVTVNQTEIVVKKGEEVELVCTSSKSEALGCSFKSPAEHNYNMLRGAAYEEGRIQQKELNPNDCAMKITNIRQSDNGIWKCNVTARDSNGEYDIGTGNINLVVAIAPVEVSMKIDSKFIISYILSSSKVNTCPALDTIALLLTTIYINSLNIILFLDYKFGCTYHLRTKF